MSDEREQACEEVVSVLAQVASLSEADRQQVLAGALVKSAMRRMRRDPDVVGKVVAQMKAIRESLTTKPPVP